MFAVIGISDLVGVEPCAGIFVTIVTSDWFVRPHCWRVLRSSISKYAPELRETFAGLGASFWLTTDFSWRMVESGEMEGGDISEPLRTSMSMLCGTVMLLDSYNVS
jgi:hypothetical protein